MKLSDNNKNMGRGKIEIKKIENLTNRQVTYSKRRNGIFKKAQELTVLCDAKVSLMMVSSTGKFHEYISPTTSTKAILDQYQTTLGIDLWNTTYERMMDNMRKLKEINNRLRREIRHRMGEDLDDLNLQEVIRLKNKVLDSLPTIRNRKNHKIKTQTDTTKKKVKNLEQRHGDLLLQYEAKCEESQYGLVDNVEDYELANAAANMYPFRVPQGQHNLQNGGGRYGRDGLRLA